jgi:signal transduction histidine kinase
MQLVFSLHTLVPLLALLISLSSLYYVIRRRTMPFAKTFSILMGVISFWALIIFIENLSLELETKIFWLKMSYFAIVTIPMLWLAFALQYTNNARWITRRNIALMAIIPIITLIIVWTNEIHHLMWKDIWLETSLGIQIDVVTHNGWFWVLITYLYSLFFTGIGLLIGVSLRLSSIHRTQAVILLIIFAIPWLSYLLFVIDVPYFSKVDPTTFVFAISCAIFMWRLPRFHLWEIVPIAKEEIFKNIPDGVVVLDNQKCVLECNPAACRIIKHKRREILGQPYNTVLPAGAAGMELHPEMDETRNLINLGLRQYIISISKIITRQHFAGYLVIMHDDTERIKAEADSREKIKLETELMERTKAAKREAEMQKELYNASHMASIGEMASGLAHEINNPLTAVIGFSQMLLEKELPDNVRDDLKIIHSESKRAAKIVSGLLTFSRQRKPSRTMADINRLLEETLSLGLPQFKINNIVVKTELADNLPQTAIDRAQIQQVFLNIILNAQQAMSVNGKGTLTIATQQVDNCIRISFSDDGPGIKKEILARLFEPFFTTREIGAGSGLGLSMCYGIVTEHKGRIYAESEPGKGARFVVELPVATLEETQITDAGGAGITAGKSGNKAVKGLLIEPDNSLISCLDCLLKSWGYTFETADNATEAMERIKNNDYDFILLDSAVPDIGGLEIYRYIYGIKPHLAKKVVFISADISQQDGGRIIRENNVPCLAKPLDYEKLKQSIERILAGG